jgi:hypothetical protein
MALSAAGAIVLSATGATVLSTAVLLASVFLPQAVTLKAATAAVATRILRRVMEVIVRGPFGFLHATYHAHCCIHQSETLRHRFGIGPQGP